MNLFTRLDAIDKTRERLFDYESRLRRLFFARALRDRQLARIAKRWHLLTEERSHIVGLIAANPQLRALFQDREAKAAAAVLSLKSPDQLPELARMLAVSHGIERDAKEAFQDAVAFLKWRDEATPIPAHEAQSVRDRLHTAFQLAQTERLTHQKAFEQALAALYDGERAILERERLMRAALKAHAAVRAAAPPKPNAFAQWHHRRTGQWPEPRQSEPNPNESRPADSDQRRRGGRVRDRGRS